jgi:polyisoprenoid-binding protein YceI
MTATTAVSPRFRPATLTQVIQGLSALPSAVSVLAFAGGLALAGAAFAQDAAPVVKSGTYTFQADHTEVVFGVSHFGFSTYYGQFPGATGTLKLDTASLADSHLDVSIPVAQVWTASPKLTDELKSADWLDAAAYPTMTFHSTKVTPTGPTTADVTGDLTLHGATHPVTLKATLTRAAVFPMTKKYMVGFQVTGAVKRSEFGVSKYVAYGLGDDVQLTISAPFERTEP